MKVCPLCEFIYEDDQSLCDMDGNTLVYDPAPQALAPVASPAAAATPARSRARRFAATAVTGVVLGTVLVLVFHVFTLRTQEQLLTTAPTGPNYSSPRDTGGSVVPPYPDIALPVPLAPQFEVLPIPAPADSPVSPARQSTRLPEERRANSGDGSALVTDPPAPAGPTAPKKEEKVQKTARANPKPVEAKQKDSGIGSFFKKTGRILKKPFSR